MTDHEAWVWSLAKRRVTEDEWRAQYDAQRGLCAICSEPFAHGEPWTQRGSLRAVVDLGPRRVLRGLLHRKCAHKLSTIEDDVYANLAHAYLTTTSQGGHSNA